MSVTEDQILRAWFESGPDGYPGRFDHVAERVKERNRPRARAILALIQNVRAQALKDAADDLACEFVDLPRLALQVLDWLRERADMEEEG